MSSSSRTGASAPTAAPNVSQTEPVALAASDLPPGGAASVEAVRITARDGRALSGLLARTPRPKGALVINSATGIPREFYLKFANYAVDRGYHALVYDYRGIGASRLDPLSQDPARMSDWGLLDMPAALEWMEHQFPSLPLLTVGHSVGGQLIGCLHNHARARGHVLIAASTGYWGLEHVPFRFFALFFWLVHGPLMLRLHGFVPRGRVWSGESLPRRVYEQWREWCLHPEAFGPALEGDLRGSQFGSVRGPLLLCGFRDDPIATPAAVKALRRFYSQAQFEERWTRPSDVGVRRIGHHGFFWERHRNTLWPPVFDWMDMRCNPDGAALSPS